MTNLVYTRFHGVDHLSKKEDFPVTDWSTFDPETLPFVQGIKDTKQVRLNFQKSPKDSHNDSIILALAKWAKENGTDLDPEFGIYLKDIELADLHRRFKEKFTRLQRVYRETDGNQKEDKKMSTVYANRAKGVSNIDQSSIHM